MWFVYVMLLPRMVRIEKETSINTMKMMVKCVFEKCFGFFVFKAEDHRPPRYAALVR